MNSSLGENAVAVIMSGFAAVLAAAVGFMGFMFLFRLLLSRGLLLIIAPLFGLALAGLVSVIVFWMITIYGKHPSADPPVDGRMNGQPQRLIEVAGIVSSCLLAIAAMLVFVRRYELQVSENLAYWSFYVQRVHSVVPLPHIGPAARLDELKGGGENLPGLVGPACGELFTRESCSMATYKV